MSEKKPVRILSFGAGVQSSAVARMSVIGEIPPFDAVIFADTGDEPQGVYENLRWWEQRFAEEGVPLYLVDAGHSLSEKVEDVVSSGAKRIPIPIFVKQPSGRGSMMRRECTTNYKIYPIRKKIRELAGVAGKRHSHITETLATQTMGISWDEPQRMKDSPYPWLRNDYPLIDLRMTRWDCIAAMAKDDRFPDPARSACFHCPFHSDEDWRYLRDHEPEAFARAVALDHSMRREGIPGASKLNGAPYLHRSCVPLDEVDFDNEEDKGQLVIWGEECEGMCGI